jgi:hypothetical protein
VIADQSRTDREMIRRLWDILLNNPHLIQAMWPQNSPFGPSWLSVRPAPGCASHGDFGGSGRCRHTAPALRARCKEGREGNPRTGKVLGADEE